MFGFILLGGVATVASAVVVLLMNRARAAKWGAPSILDEESMIEAHARAPRV
jgi:hypothetical protein